MPDFRARLLGRLTGISDRSLDQHLALYERYVQELAAIADAYPKVSWTAPPEALSLPPGDIQRVLDTPIASLPLTLERGKVADVLARLKAEVNARGLTFWPNFYLGDDDFWTTDRATSVNVPWYLGSPETWMLVNDRRLKLTEDDVLRILRHEYAHALLYAFEGWHLTRWRQAFGDFDAPYLDAYVPDPARAGDFVQNLGRPGPGQLAHYPQKHPDEDWAETFAVWVAGGPAAPPAPGSGADAKLAAVEALVTGQGAFYGEPVVRARGRTEPFQAQAGTVGDYLGAGGRGFSEHAALLRREPEVFAAVGLHEAYFEALGGAGSMYVERLNPGPRFAARAAAAYGSFDAWATDLRAISGATSGWALACWDPVARRVRNFLVEGHDRGVPPGCPILLACDVWEHSYAMDYGIHKHIYLAAFYRNIDWSVVEQRLARAMGIGESGRDESAVTGDSGWSATGGRAPDEGATLVAVDADPSKQTSGLSRGRAESALPSWDPNEDY